MMDKIEKTVFQNLETQSKIISKTFKEMGICITAFLENNPEIHKSITKIENNEKEANKIRRKNLEIVAQVVSIYRDDLFRLVLKMSDVMSNQAGASIRLGKIKFNPHSKDGMIPKFKSLISEFIKMGEQLKNLMRQLGENKENTTRICGKMDEIEEKVDNIYRDLHGFLYNRIDIPLRIIMQLLSVAKHIEEGVDYCASVADSVRIILTSH